MLDRLIGSSPLPDKRPAKPTAKRLEAFAIGLVWIPIAIAVLVGMVVSWRTTLPLLAAYVALLVVLVVAVTTFRIELTASAPGIRLYALGAIGGPAGGLVFGLLSPTGFSPLTALKGAFHGAAWFWLGHFLRAPFGASPSPPYRSQDVTDRGPS